MPKVNHEILKWARIHAKLSEEEAVKKLGIKDIKNADALSRLAALENGETSPSRAMLVKMSNKYRRPLLTFYLSTPPRIGDRGEDYRTLPDTIDLTDEALVDALIRDIRARQSLVRAVLEDEEETERLLFIGSISMEEGRDAAVATIKDTIDWNEPKYWNAPSIDNAFSYLREKAEEAGIFVLLIDNLGNYLTTIDVESFRGFALADEVAPFIAVNANDTKGAWCFTLVHEMVHLWLGLTGVSGSSAENEIEKFCNDVASEFLVPMHDVQNIMISNKTEFNLAKETIRQFAQSRNVSGTMVAYKLYRGNVITYKRYVEFKTSFREDWIKFKNSLRAKQREKKKKGGPDYYITKTHRLGHALINFVGRMVYGGALTTTKAGKVLGVKPHNVQGVLEQSGSYTARELV